MTRLDYDPAELDDLLEKVCEQSLTDAETARLNAVLAASRGARQRYRRYMGLHASLYWDRAGSGAQQPVTSNDAGDGEFRLDDAMILPALNLPDEPEPAVRATVVRAPAPRVPERPTRWRWWTAAAASLVVGTSVALLLLRGGDGGTPRPVSVDPPAAVATVTAEAGAVWGDPAAAATVGASLVAGRTLDLRAGCVEIAFARGVTVVVEGPARLTVLEAGRAVSLASGRLVANVPGGGFVVHTPASTVTDLGTEFGVAAGVDGTTSVEVFTGRVEAVATPAAGGGRDAVPARVLTEGEAATVSAAAGVTIDPLGAVPQRFVRRLRGESVAVVNVGDLIAGGDGTTGRSGIGIDARTGNAGPLDVVSEFPGDGLYHRVPALPVVDGCFVPDGRKGPFRVDSAGHAFAFPAANGVGFNHVWAGLPKSDKRKMMEVSTAMAGIDYSGANRGLVYMHANLGLTLDLDAIRRLHPGKELSRFRAVVGHSEPKVTDKPVRLDAFVLVDGTPRFAGRGMVPSDAPRGVDIPLRPTDRFLTLAVTDGGDGIEYDGLLWGDPFIDLADRSPRR